MNRNWWTYLRFCLWYGHAPTSYTGDAQKCLECGARIHD